MDFEFKVKKSEHGKRLESFIYEKLGTWSHKQVKAAIDNKRAFLNGKNVFIANWNVKAGDRILFKPGVKDLPQARELSRYQFVQVLFEDDALLVTNKPAFVDFDTFVLQVNAYLKRKGGDKFYPYVGQMHRLDRETSGILIFTKKKSANVLSDQFREHRIRKYYLAICYGAVEKEHDTIEERIIKGKFEGGRKAQIAEDGEGKESYTEYWVKERYSHASYLRILLKTGRTHQIRVHLASIGHPLMGDKLYLDAENKKLLTNNKIILPKIKRQALHAEQVEFKHPITNEKMVIKAPLPDDMKKLLDALRMGE